MNAQLLVVGDPFFLERHRPLIEALRARLGNVTELPVSKRAILPKIFYLALAVLKGRFRPIRFQTLRSTLQRFDKEPATFARISRVTARSIAAIEPAPSIVLQFFSMSSPADDKSRLPYAHYIDMTMALVGRSWPAWAPFLSDARHEKWLALEGASYRGAERVFTFSEATRRSVIDDYGAQAERVVAVGAAGHYERAASVERTYGNRTIVFNGSDFERKGGDRVLAAFRIVREHFPEATLTVVGADVCAEAGIVSLGSIPRTALFALLDRTDVVLAPTRLDVLPGFVLEAMSRGVVPVLSDADSMDEIVSHGIDGFLASPPSPERLAEYVITLFSNSAHLSELGEAARRRVARDWNWDAVAAKMIASLTEGAVLHAAKPGESPPGAGH